MGETDSESCKRGASMQHGVATEWLLMEAERSEIINILHV